MTTTALVTTQSIGTGSNKGDGILPQKATLAGSTQNFVLSMEITNGAGGYVKGSRISAWYATSPFSYTAADGVVQLRNKARYLEIIVSHNANIIHAAASVLEPVAGQYLYVWFDIPVVTVAQTMNVSYTEFDGPIGGSAASPTITAGLTYHPVLSFARTADTNAYAAGDVIGINAAGSPGSAIHTLTGAGPSGGSVIITGWDLTIDATAIPAGMTTFGLDLYDASPTAILDNAAFDLVTADQLKHIARLDDIAVVDVGSSLYAFADNLNKCIKLAAATTSLFAELRTNGAWTPASGTTFRIRLHALLASMT